MILQVAVSRELIEQWFTTGHEMHGVLRVTEGIPAGAQLRGARMDNFGERLWLLFETEGDRTLCEPTIRAEANRELAELEERLAFENACISIEVASIRNTDGWLEIAPKELANLADEIRYLELRGQLERHASDPALIKLPADAEIAEVTS
jgi:hypothetical protein